MGKKEEAAIVTAITNSTLLTFTAVSGHSSVLESCADTYVYWQSLNIFALKNGYIHGWISLV